MAKLYTVILGVVLTGVAVRARGDGVPGQVERDPADQTALAPGVGTIQHGYNYSSSTPPARAFDGNAGNYVNLTYDAANKDGTRTAYGVDLGADGTCILTSARILSRNHAICWQRARGAVICGSNDPDWFRHFDVLTPPTTHTGKGQWNEVHATSTQAYRYLFIYNPDPEAVTYGPEIHFFGYNVTAKAGVGGSVKLGDGEAAQSLTAYASLSDPVTLTAIPDGGYSFLRWEGRVTAITDGSSADATIRVGRLGELRAVFTTADRKEVGQLERVPSDQTLLAEGVSIISNGYVYSVHSPRNAFDGDCDSMVNLACDEGKTDGTRTGYGVDFGENGGCILTYAQILGRRDGLEGFTRVAGAVICGSNDSDWFHNFEIITAATEPTEMGQWNTVIATSDKAYRYMFIYNPDPTAPAWGPQTAEIRLFGYNVQVKAEGKGKVKLGDGEAVSSITAYANADRPITLTAIPETDDVRFERWEGRTAAIIEGDERSPMIRLGAHAELTAVFGSAPGTVVLIDHARAEEEVKTVWSVGTKDGTGNEFALAPSQYDRFLDSDFGWEDRYYLIGHSTAKNDFPYVLPDEADAWAGSSQGAGRRTQRVNILFDLASKGGKGPWSLFVDFADAQHTTPPLVKVEVNGEARKFLLPKGGGDASIKQGDFSKAVPYTVRIDLAPDEVRVGPNEVMITSIEGSWAIFDSVRLEGPVDARVNLDHGDAFVRRVRAGDYLIPGTQTQPLLVEVEHLAGVPVVRVEVDGNAVLTQTVESGAYLFEAPMPAVAEETLSGYRVFVDERLVREGTVTRSPQRDVGVAGYVNTRMGTAHSRWMLAPGPWMPFSMVKLSPDNEGEPGKGLWQGGYDPVIESVGTFSHIHEWTMAGLGTMPVTGSLKIKMGGASEQTGHADGYRSSIDKRSEICKAGYYAVRLTDYDIYAELTATDRCGFQRYTYPAGQTPRVMIDLLTPTEYTYSIVGCEMRQTGPRRIEGFSKQETPRVWSVDADQFYTVYFVLEFDRDITAFAGWESGVTWTGSGRTAQQPSSFGGYVEFAQAAGQTVVQLRSGISFVDLDGASNNLRREVEEPFGWDFERVRAANETAWIGLLGRVAISTCDRREKMRFYTNLYRSFCRNTFSDVDGRWNDPLDQVRQLGDSDARALGCDAFWNTFWNLNQVWNLIGPEWSARWVKSQMALYDAGGWLGKGPAGMRYVPVMVAEHEIPQMVSAWQMGIRPCESERLMAAFTKMQTTPAQKVGRGYAGNRNLVPYLAYHYVPSDKGTFSNSMEYSYDDWTVGQFALAIGRMDDYAVFNDRGGWWRNAVNPETGYCQLRDSGGAWKASFDPFSGSGYTEGNGWQLTYFVPQDVPALVDHIGRDRFLERLKWGFEQSCPLRYNAPGEHYAAYPVVQGNQQSMHFAFLFNWAGEPWESQKWVRSILERYYGYGDADAWLGDEDQGQMSAWLVMAALGLFQTDGGCRAEPVYEIASPLYEEAVIELGNRFGRGAAFTIRAHGASRVNKYVQRAELNGEPLNTFLVDANEVLRGGTLELWMGPEPNREWGVR